MKYQDLVELKLEGKKVVIKDSDGNSVTTTLPKIIDSDSINVLDKYNKARILTISTLLDVREV